MAVVGIEVTVSSESLERHEAKGKGHITCLVVPAIWTLPPQPATHRQQQILAELHAARVASAEIELGKAQQETFAANVLQASWRGYNTRRLLHSSRATRRSLEARKATELQASVCNNGFLSLRGGWPGVATLTAI